jgi:hypothetical protein
MIFRFVYPTFSHDCHIGDFLYHTFDPIFIGAKKTNKANSKGNKGKISLNGRQYHSSRANSMHAEG